MIRAALVAIALLALPAVVLAQSAPPVANSGHPANPKPKPSGAAGHGANGHNNGNAQPQVYVDAKDFIASPKPHTSNPPSHVNQYPGTETFGSQTTGSH